MPTTQAGNRAPVVMPSKDPDDISPYAWDWTDFLGADTISTSTVTVIDVEVGGVEVDEDSEASEVVTAVLSGGIAGRRYRVLCNIVTAAGNEYDQTMIVPVREH